MPDVLDNILSARRVSLAKAKSQISFSELEQRAKHRGASNEFSKAVNDPLRISVIAEMKRKSPSAGDIRSAYSPEDLAKAYQQGGAHALSVLTDPDFFGGEISHVERVKSACSLPILRKDFIFDVYQVIEARAAGADAVLLIADMLDRNHLKELVAAAREFNLESLVEVFTAGVIDSALDTGTRIMGINSRNLRTLQMFPNNFKDLSRYIPKDRALVAESGIKTASDVEALKSLSFTTILVGESLLKQGDTAAGVKNLVQAGAKR